jgi:phosphoserine phosphatase
MEQLPALIRQYSESQVAAMAEWVVEHELWPKRRQAMLDELAQHRAANKRVVVASGAYQPVLAAFCARLDVECIGTPLEMRDGRLTGRLSGPLNVADTKAASITRLTAGQPIEMAYGDTVQDLPLLKLAKTPVAVNPEPKLRALALAHGWRIIEDAG